MPPDATLIVIKGGGDLASAIAHQLFSHGYRPVIVESPTPATTRRSMAFATAVFDGTVELEGVRAERAETIDRVTSLLHQGGCVPVYTGPAETLLAALSPQVLIDARMRKREIAEKQIDHALLVIGLGPGFSAGETVHCVIETNRGPNLGKLITSGSAEAYTGRPIAIQGYAKERYTYAPSGGVFQTTLDVGHQVRVGQVLGRIGQTELRAQVSGIIRGLTKDGIRVSQGTKIAEVDPRGREEHVQGIAERPRAVARGVLEALRHFVAG